MTDIATLGIRVDSKSALTADRNLDKLTGSSRKTEKATDSLRRANEKLNKVLKVMAFAAVAAGIAATTYALKKSITMYAAFEKEMANVSTLLNTNVVSMGKLQKELLGLNANLGSATELTKGLYQALSAGVDAAKAVEFVGRAARAAKAGLSDTFTAVDAGTTILNAFGMATKDATFVYDLMFKTVKEGKTTFGELASAVGKISPIASAAGVSVTEMHAALATLTKGGFKTTEASARLATALGTIIKPSSEAQKLAESLGLEFNATALRSKNLSGFLQDVTKATGGSVEKMALLFGGMESLSVMLALAGKQSEEFADILEGMGYVTGEVDEAFDKVKVTLTEVWETFKNTIGKQAIMLGEKLAPKIDEILTGMTAWVDANDDLIAQKIPVYFDRIATAANVVRDGVAGVTSTFLALAAGSLTAYAGILNVAKAFAYLRSKVGVGEEYRAKYKAIYEELVIDAQAATDAATALAAKSQEPFLGSLEDTANAATKATKEAAEEIKDIWLSHAKDLQAIRDKELAANAKAAKAAQKATIKSEIDTTDFVKAYNEIEAVKQSASEMAGKIEKVYGKELADAYIESVVSAYRDGILETERASQAQKDIWSDYNEDYQILLIGEEEFKRQQYIKGLDLYLRIEQEKTGATAEEMAKRRALILEDYDKSGDDIDNLADTGKTAMETLTDAVNNFGAQSSQVITDFALHGKASFSDMIDSMIEDLVRMMIQEQIMGPLFKGISGVLFGSATGNAFEGGNVIPFASGGVVTRPTVFPMAQGAGLMGEAGPEAILPLKRVASGNLGVEASGGGMQMQVTIYNSTGDSVETKQGKTADGSPTLDVMIDQAVAKKLGTFGSKSNKAMRQNFGASQRLTRR